MLRLPSHYDGKARTTSRLEGLVINLMTGSISPAKRRFIDTTINQDSNLHVFGEVSELN